jgi:hypothetical protein
LRVNVGKTKVMRCAKGSGIQRETGQFPCAVCMMGVGSNSIFCDECEKWVHKKCSGVKGPLKAVKGFRCSSCKGRANGLIDTRMAERKRFAELEAGVTIDCVDKFCYLGDMFCSGGGAAEASRMRVKCGWKKFSELSHILRMRGASLKMKGQIYSACVRSVMTYGSETWPMKVEDTRRLERTERMMVRHMCGVSLKDRKSMEDLRGRLKIESISDVIRRNRLRWFGHVERKEDNDWVKKCQHYEVKGSRGRGRGRKTWKECVEADMKMLGLKREDAQDRVSWRQAICGGPSDPCQHGNDVKRHVLFDI